MIMITMRKFTTMSLALAWLGIGIAYADGFDPVIENRSPEVSDPGFSATEGFQMTVRAAPGSYGVEFSDDLIDWQSHDDLVLEEASAAFMDVGSLGEPQRFYRLSGEYEASDYHFINAFLAVESMPGMEGEGRLRSGFEAFETVRLGSTGAERVSLSTIGERFAQVTNAKGGPFTQGTVRAGAARSTVEGETVLADVTPSGFTIQIPALNNQTLSGFPEARLEWEMALESLADELTTLAGIGTSSYEIQESATVVGNEISLFLMGRKSVNADAAGMEGPWGLVRWLHKAADSDQVLPNYNVGAYAFDINANQDDNTFDFTYVREVEIEQNLQGGPPSVNLEHEDEDDEFSFPFTVEPDGTVDVPEIGFRGFVSSSADFMALTGVDPDLLGDLENNGTIHQAEDEATAEYVVAVRRDVAPQLAGRSYRLMGQGVIVQDGKFETFELALEENSLVIASDGETAVETNQINWFAADFGGGSSAGSDGPFTLSYDISIDPSGLIRMDGEIFEEDVEYTLFGFAQEGGRVLILTKAIAEGGDDAADLAVVIAVEMESDPAFGPDSGDFSVIDEGTWGVFEDGILDGEFTIIEYRNVDLLWNGVTVKTSKFEAYADDELQAEEWYAKSEDGSVYFLQRDEADGDLEINIPPSLTLPASPTLGQTWNNDGRELEVLDLDGTSPNGITGCVVIRETSDNFVDTIWFKDGVIVAIQEQEPDMQDPGEILYRTGP